MTAILIESETPFDSNDESSSKNSGKQRLLFDDDDEAGNFTGKVNTVSDARVAIRLGFLRKVFGILSVQLVLTTAIGAAFVYTPGLKGVVQQWSWMVIVGIVLSIILLIAMFVKRHETPTNYILLFLWTGVQAYMVGVAASFADRDVVVYAFFMTAVVVVSLLLYTLQSKRDFSMMGSGLYAVLCIMIVGGFIQMFMMNEMLEFVLSIGGAILFSLYIIYDVHVMMTQMNAEEYILATINLYLDIINLFIYILRFFEAIRRHTN